MSAILPLLATVTAAAQQERVFKPEVAIRNEDYAAVRRQFRTTLRTRGPSPANPAHADDGSGGQGSLLVKDR